MAPSPSTQNFIEHYLDHNKQYESPTSFWYWSALISIASVLRDSVWIPDGDGKLYPNIYVLFLADSAARKGRPVAFAENLVFSVHNTKIISGRSSIQGILDELAHTETDSKTGKLVKGGSAIFFAPELASGIVEDPAATGILTDIYDGKTNFTHRLRHSPKFKVDRIVFNALMASNEALIRGVFDQRATHGGLLGRTFLVIPDETRSPNSLMRFKGNPESRKLLEEKLLAISLLKGEMIFTDYAVDEFEHWYENNYLKLRHRGDKGGVAGRIHTGVKKVAILLAANELSIEIEKRHVEEAINVCIKLLPNYNNFILSTGKSTIADAGAIFVAELVKAREHKVARDWIMREHWQDFDPDIFDKLTATLETAGLIQSIVMEENKMGFKLTQKGIEAFNK